MKKSMIMGLVALCLLVFAVAAASAEDDQKKPQRCKPIEKYDACWPFMKKGYHGQAPSYGSRCCELLRDDSPDCICKAVTGRGSDIDREKALETAKGCGKKSAEYYCAPKKSPPPPPPKKYSPPPEKYSPPPPKKYPPPPYEHKSPPPPPPEKYPPPPEKYSPPPPKKSPPPPNKYPPPPKHY